MRARLFAVLGVLVGLGALAYGGWVWHYAVTFVWTDDAYVEGTVAPVSAKVAGHVADLHVGDNQAVRRGDLLLRLDPRDFQVKVEQARAAVATAEAQLRAARAEVPLTRDTTRAQTAQARAAVEAALVAVRAGEAAIEEARARLEARRSASAAMRAELAGAGATRRQARRELERVQALLRDGLVARRDFDQAEAAFDTAAAAEDAMRRRLAQTEREVQQAEAEVAVRTHASEEARQRVAEARAALTRATSQEHQVAVKEAEASRAEARLREAQADLAYAELQLEHTQVRAPVDGVVSKRNVEVGQVVQASQPLLALVPLQDVWIVANFKETQLVRLRTGMDAEVRVDGFPNHRFHGVVESMSAGTGARFSLLPPENATGNWVKVVQRIPVKIRLDAPVSSNPATLRAGMSAVVTIRVR